MTPSGSFHRLEFAVVPAPLRLEPGLVVPMLLLAGLIRVPVSWLRMTTPTTTMATAAETASTGFSQAPAGPRRPGRAGLPAVPAGPPAVRGAEQAAQEADQGEQGSDSGPVRRSAVRPASVSGFEPDEKTGSVQTPATRRTRRKRTVETAGIQPVTDALQSVAAGSMDSAAAVSARRSDVLVVPILCHHACRPGALCVPEDPPHESRSSTARRAAIARAV